MAKAKKPPVPKKSLFHKAAELMIAKDPERCYFIHEGLHWCGVEFRDETDRITAAGTAQQLVVSEVTDLGDILQFIHKTISSLDPLSPPTHLGGNGKDLEELLMGEARRLEKTGTLTMGRYGTMVSMVDDAWLPVPSLPDFEGVRAGGRQFIIEAKVCTQPSFRIQKDKLKHKQVKHMLKRSQFGVDCYILIHFNARLGRTFYDPAFTVAIPIKSAKEGGWEVWEQFADCKDKEKEFTPLTRELAQQIGRPVCWHIPPRSSNLRPDLMGIIHTQ